VCNEVNPVGTRSRIKFTMVLEQLPINGAHLDTLSDFSFITHDLMKRVNKFLVVHPDHEQQPLNASGMEVETLGFDVESAEVPEW
jgi:hypothetical protein